MGYSTDMYDQYASAIRSAHSSSEKYGEPPSDEEHRERVITWLEKMIFHGNDTPLLFKAISYLYITKGLVWVSEKD